MTSAELLSQTVELYSTVQSNWRDGLLEVGRSLRRFLEAKVAEVEGLSTKQAANRERTREAAILEAADTMRVNRNRIYLLIMASAVADLLGASGLGPLSFSAIAAFRQMVKRAGVMAKRYSGSELAAARAEREKWVVTSPIAQSMFERAVEECWRVEDVKAAIRGLPARNRKNQSRKEEASCCSIPAVIDIAKTATPKDLADLIERMIEASVDPETVRESLLLRKPVYSWN